MVLLITGLALFLGGHSIGLIAPGFRQATMARIGELPWKAGYSVVSLLGFVLLCYGYGAARAEASLLWSPPLWTHHLTALLMLPTFILLLAGNVPGNRIRARLGHPMVLSVKLWAFAHLLSNGGLHDVLLFGSFLAWAVADFIALRRKDRALQTVYAPGRPSRDALVVALGVVAYAAFALWGHRWLIGVSPFAG